MTDHVKDFLQQLATAIGTLLAVLSLLALVWGGLKAIDYCFPDYSTYVLCVGVVYVFFREYRRLHRLLKGEKIEVQKLKVIHLVAISLAACLIILLYWYGLQVPRTGWAYSFYLHDPQQGVYLWSCLTGIVLMEENGKLMNRLKELGKDSRTGQHLPPVISQPEAV